MKHLIIKITTAELLLLILLSGTRLRKRHQLKITLSRDLKYFDDVELVVPSDQFQVCLIFSMITGNSDKPRIPVANTKPGFVSVFCEYLKDPTHLKLVRFFSLFSASKKTSFLFCFWLCSELLQLKLDKKNISRKLKFLSPQDSFKGEKGGKYIFTISTFL